MGDVVLLVTAAMGSTVPGEAEGEAESGSLCMAATLGQEGWARARGVPGDRD